MEEGMIWELGGQFVCQTLSLINDMFKVHARRSASIKACELHFQRVGRWRGQGTTSKEWIIIESG
jgi:hypothetical protein